MAKKARKAKKARRRRGSDPIARRNRRFQGDIRTAFVNAGFTQVSTRNVTVEHAGMKTDFDAIFCKNNVLVIVEDTTEADPADHLRKKVDIWGRMNADTEKFVETLVASFDKLRELLSTQPEYQFHDYQVRFVYVSFHSISDELAARYSNAISFLDNPRLQYFVSLSKTVSRSSLFEMLSFLRVDLAGYGVATSARSETEYTGLYLPETPSGFPKGHKIVSLLMDPHTLLERSYVLRADGWRDSDALYQRLLVKNKINEMREYLRHERRVFVNNVIVTFPAETVLSAGGTRIDLEDSGRRTQIQEVKINLPRRLASIGIIDGQHRIFAYHEGIDDLETYIRPLRSKQHLLVTGIVYPRSVTAAAAQQFEAKLFLEINDKQKRVRGDLKQAIEMIVRPRSAVAVAKAVVNAMAGRSPFLGYLETHAFDVGKLKTTSIVSYGLKYVVDPGRADSLMAHWVDEKKTSFPENDDALHAYIQYCSRVFSEFFAALKAHVGNEMWTTDRTKSRVMNATAINGMIYAMRQIVSQGKPLSFETYKKRFRNLKVSFEPSDFRYKSSHWKALGEKVLADCFSDMVQTNATDSK